jgi:hypothetical protein
MAKPLALIGTLLLLAGCSVADTVAPDPSFAHATRGCATATERTAGTPGADGVAKGCTAGH